MLIHLPSPHNSPHKQSLYSSLKGKEESFGHSKGSSGENERGVKTSTETQEKIFLAVFTKEKFFLK